MRLNAFFKIKNRTVLKRILLFVKRFAITLHARIKGGLLEFAKIKKKYNVKIIKKNKLTVIIDFVERF